MFNFEELVVWHEAIAFAGLGFERTRRYPREERFGLTNQMLRAVMSVSSIVAGRCFRSSRREHSHFVEIATGSVYEVVSQATVSRNQEYLSEQEYCELYKAAESQSRMLSGLRRSLERP